MKRCALILFAVLGVLPAVGCGTLLNQSQPGSYFNVQGQRRPNRLYGGVRSDCEILAEGVAHVARGEPVFSSSSKTEWDPVTGESVWRDTTPGYIKTMDAISMTLFLAADFPLSFAADTILLPVDIIAQWKRLTGRTPAEEKPKPAEPPTEGPHPPSPSPFMERGCSTRFAVRRIARGIEPPQAKDQVRIRLEHPLSMNGEGDGG